MISKRWFRILVLLSAVTLLAGVSARCFRWVPDMPDTAMADAKRLLATNGLHAAEPIRFARRAALDSDAPPTLRREQASDAVGLPLSEYEGEPLEWYRARLSERSTSEPSDVYVEFMVSGDRLVGAALWVESEKEFLPLNDSSFLSGG